VITAGAKLWFAITAIALVAAELYFLGTGGDDGGAITLLFIAAGAATIGGASIATRDGDVATGDDVETVAIRSALPAPWPALGALGAGITIVGFAVGGLLFYLGIGVIVATFVEWMVSSWAERSSADPAYNQALRNRIMFPVEVPALGLLGVAFIIIAFSRVLLAVPEVGSIIVAGVVATIITAVGFLVAYRPRIGSGALSWLLAVSAVALLGAGILGGVAGEREIEHHETEHVEGVHPDEGVGGEGDETEGGEGTIADDGSHDEQEEPAE
jgi:hypothetical protein